MFIGKNEYSTLIFDIRSTLSVVLIQSYTTSSVHFNAFVSCVVTLVHCLLYIFTHCISCVLTSLPDVSSFQITGSNWRMDKLISARLSDEARVAFPEKLNGSMKPRLFWMTNKGIPCILYDGVPFATGGSEKISCKPASKQRSKDVSLCNVDAYK